MDRELIYVLGRDECPSTFKLASGQSLKATLLAPRGVSGSFDICIELCGEGAELDLAGIYLCEGEQKVDFRINVRHLVGNCKSTQLFKGLADGKSRLSFDGLVYVAAGAQKTQALQENHSLLLSGDALVQSSPQLAIYADDVVCSHGSTIGSLSQEEQFYRRSRGIDEATARELQIRSFLSPVLERLGEEDLRFIL